MPLSKALALLAALVVASGATAAGADDHAAILAALSLTADGDGRVVNECGEAVAPGFLPVELGGAVGTATLLVMEGGPEMVSCYGDGPDLHLFRDTGGGVEEIYSARGRALIVLPGMTDGVHDIADGGPGFSFPLWQWDGTTYVYAEREIAESDLGEAIYLP